MKSSAWLVLPLVFLAGCSSDSFKRAAYSTLQNVEQGRCQTDTTGPCPQQQGYDEYQLQRKELENNQ